MFKKILKVVGRTAGVILVASVFAAGGYTNDYISYPVSPVPEEGKIVPVKIKGGVHYITKDQYQRSLWIWDVTVGSGIVVALVIALVVLLYGRETLNER